MAFLKLGHSSVVTTAVNRARSATCNPSVSVWIDSALIENWNVLPDKLRPSCSVVVSESLAECVSEYDAEVVLVHDAQRPLTLSSTFDRVAQAVIAGADAVRPAHVVVDTLKTVDENKRITSTINRDLVQSLTSPEGFRRSAVDFAGASDAWSLPLKVGATTDFVRGDQESLRVREAEDVLLVESFLAWQTIQN
jgi:2-C-methyl-D-erythritol 4-phosphate cytidylyltransferase